MVRKVTFYWILLTLILVDSWLIVKAKYSWQSRVDNLQISLPAIISPNLAYGMDRCVHLYSIGLTCTVFNEAEKIIEKNRFFNTRCLSDYSNAHNGKSVR